VGTTNGKQLFFATPPIKLKLGLDYCKYVGTTNGKQLFFATPPIKLKLGLDYCIYVGTTNGKQPGPIGQSKIGNSSQIIFITLFSNRCTAFAAPFSSLSKLSKYAGTKPFLLDKPAKC
jgi:hypothetical protein